MILIELEYPDGDHLAYDDTLGINIPEIHYVDVDEILPDFCSSPIDDEDLMFYNGRWMSFHGLDPLGILYRNLK